MQQVHGGTKTGARDNTRWGRINKKLWGASAAPLPDISLLVVDELPPPLLDCGQGKISSTKGVDGGERGMDKWLQATVLRDGERWDKFQTSNKDMTAKRDCIPASDASRLPNSVDLPRSETTPTPSSVVPPSGENLTVNADTMVNGVHPPSRDHLLGQGRGLWKRRSMECTPPSSDHRLGQGRGCGGEIPLNVAPPTLPRQVGDLPLWTACNRLFY